MPIYGYSCREHGEFEIFQNINDIHEAHCSCGLKANRVFYPIPAHGDLPSTDKRIGKTRGELFDNLASEGLYYKDWRKDDEPEVKRFTDAGIKEKPMVGWTPSLG